MLLDQVPTKMYVASAVVDRIEPFVRGTCVLLLESTFVVASRASIDVKLAASVKQSAREWALEEGLLAGLCPQ